MISMVITDGDGHIITTDGEHGTMDIQDIGTAIEMYTQELSIMAARHIITNKAINATEDLPAHKQEHLEVDREDLHATQTQIYIMGQTYQTIGSEVHEAPQ